MYTFFINIIYVAMLFRYTNIFYLFLKLTIILNVIIIDNLLKHKYYKIMCRKIVNQLCSFIIYILYLFSQPCLFFI